MGEYCQAKGTPFISHSDGKITEIIPDLMAIGINALHPIEPKAMDIFELKRSIGKRACLIGNLDLDRLLTRGTPEEVDQGARYLIERLAPGGGYVLGSSNSIAHFVPPANYIAMLRARNKYGCF
jgi:uroporphyrinogen decarboxylase